MGAVSCNAALTPYTAGWFRVNAVGFALTVPVWSLQAQLLVVQFECDALSSACGECMQLDISLNAKLQR